MLSRNKFIKKNNKKLFEARLGIKNNSGLKINKISFDNKINQSNNISFLNISQPIIIEENAKKKNKNQEKEENFSFNDNIITRNLAITKKYEKNRNKKKNLKANIYSNNLNLYKKDISFFGNYNYNSLNDTTRISVNKKLTTQNSNNKSLERKRIENHMKNNRNKKKSIKNNKEISHNNSLIKSMKINNEKNLILNLKNKNSIIYKFNITSKYKLKNNNNDVSKNDSGMNNNISNHNQNSILIEKIKKKGADKNTHLKNSNMNLEYKINYKGRNVKNNNNKVLYDSRRTQRNLNEKHFLNFSKNTLGEIKLSHNTSIINNKGKIFNNENEGNKTNINLDTKNNFISNKLTINKKNKSIKNENNNINKKFTNKFKIDKKCGTKAFITFNNPIKNKSKKIYQNFGALQNKNNEHNNLNNNNKNNGKKLGKSKEKMKENNGTSTKSNDEFASDNDHKKNETSIEEESGILSINELEDIICYNNMSNINKEDNYLFYSHERLNFLEKNKKRINKLFFGNKNPNKSYKQSKIKIKKKTIESLDTDFKYCKYTSKFKDQKVLSYNNSCNKKYN